MKYFHLLFFFLLSISLSAQNLTFTSYFDFDSAVLSELELNKLTAFLKGNPNIDILLVRGFTDPKGKTSYNQSLAKKRINFVTSILQENEFEEVIIGENYPQTASLHYEQLRKVEITYQIKELIQEKPKTPSSPIENSIAVEKPLENNRFEELTTSSEEVSIDLDVKFVGGEAVLLKESHSDLESFFEFLEAHQEIKILIRGHVCCFNDYELSVKRAETIYKYLVQRGIDSSRLSYKGYSNTMPKVSPERNEEDRVQNRRVDVVIVK